ncbi:MAG TPA: hypothetical protein VLZ28_06405 [Daejeonella sp.]|nr:hypothetical protein [Daejeonella sp.]
MNNIDTRQIATYGLLSILSIIVLFHLLVICGIIPFEIVWGGRLKDFSQMIVFETISISLNLVMLFVVASDASLIKLKLNSLIIRIGLWTMCALFILNTAGNLLSNNETERLVFTPLTVLLSVFSFRLAVSRKTGGNN